MSTAIIGYTGFIGSYLCQHKTFDFYYNSTDFIQLPDREYSVVYCAAPTGNRILANQDPEQDLTNIQSLIKVLSQIKTEKFVLISTVDTIVNPNTPYGKNRLAFEYFVQGCFSNSYILRLSSLIDSNIKKNLLYDLKHKQWISSINPDASNQWYPLTYLINDIDCAIESNQWELNFVSEPIVNIDIVQTFAPELLDQITTKSNTTCYDVKPYRFTKEEIFKHIKRYMT